MSSDTVSPDSYRRSKWRWGLSGLLLLLMVWGVLPGGIWPQEQEEENEDSGPVREPVFIISDLAAAVALQSDGKIVVAGGLTAALLWCATTPVVVWIPASVRMAR